MGFRASYHGSGEGGGQDHHWLLWPPLCYCSQGPSQVFSKRWTDWNFVEQSYQISHLRCTNSTKASTATGSDGILQQPCQQGIPSLPKVLKAVSLNWKCIIFSGQWKKKDWSLPRNMDMSSQTRKKITCWRGRMWDRFSMAFNLVGLSAWQIR